MKCSLKWLFLAILLPALLLAGCASPARDVATGKAATDSYALPRPAATAAPAAAPRGAGVAPAQPMPEVLNAIEADRKIILTANLSLVVTATENTVASIKDMAVARGGFVSSSNIWHEDNVLHASMQVRVPAAQMEAFLAEVKKMATEVQREQTGGRDVTEEYVDIQAQLTNLEATEKELRELLTTVREKTGKAEDVMAVYRELSSVRGQIDQIKGRIQYLDRSVELATVDLQLTERGPERIGQPGWEPLQTARRALGALVETAKFLVDALIYVLLFVVPLLLVPAFLVWLLVHLVRRRAEKKRPSSSPSPSRSRKPRAGQTSEVSETSEV